MLQVEKMNHEIKEHEEIPLRQQDEGVNSLKIQTNSNYDSLPKQQCQIGVEDVAVMVWSPRKLRGSKMIIESLGKKCHTICK